MRRNIFLLTVLSESRPFSQRMFEYFGGEMTKVGMPTSELVGTLYEMVMGTVPQLGLDACIEQMRQVARAAEYDLVELGEREYQLASLRDGTVPGKNRVTVSLSIDYEHDESGTAEAIELSAWASTHCLGMLEVLREIKAAFTSCKRVITIDLPEAMVSVRLPEDFSLGGRQKRRVSTFYCLRSEREGLLMEHADMITRIEASPGKILML